MTNLQADRYRLINFYYNFRGSTQGPRIGALQRKLFTASKSNLSAQDELPDRNAEKK